jgi:thymidylate synthase ThyX
MYETKIIADSVCNGNRLTTMQLTHPRIVHSEFMTHCMFARNASSSRAIPIKKMIERVLTDPFIPIYWGKNQSGMQAAKELCLYDQALARSLWLDARDQAVKNCELLDSLGLHKQICNRLLEPFGWITVCVTGDSGAWSNYFALRCHPDAQPEIKKQAEMARDIYFESKPEELEMGEWHLPYLTKEEEINLGLQGQTEVRISIKVSVGRCARTSYLTQEGTRDQQKDIDLHDRLVNSTPIHASPLEHVCIATGNNQRYGKYTGWKSYRHMIPGEYVTNYERPQ